MKKPNIITDPSVIEKVDGFIKARDVRFELQGSGVDPKVVHILERLAEQGFQNDKQLTAMAGAMSQMASIIGDFTLVAENMKRAYEDMKGTMKGPVQ